MSISILGKHEIIPLVNYMLAKLPDSLPSISTREVIASELHKLNAQSFNERYPDHPCIPLTMSGADFDKMPSEVISDTEAFFLARDLLIESSEYSDLANQLAYRWLQLVLKKGLGCQGAQFAQKPDDRLGTFVVTKSPRQIMGYVIDSRVGTKPKLLFSNQTLSGKELNVLVIDIINRRFYRSWVDESQIAVEYDYTMMPYLSVADIEDVKARLEQQANIVKVDAETQRQLYVKQRNDFNSEVEACMPVGCKAVIIATLHVNESDLMSDYHGHSVKETMILAFSTHTKAIFSEMRKAAANSDKTSHLSDSPKSYEHRENYSMGAGNYLKEGSHDSNGWCIAKKILYSGVSDIPVGCLQPVRAKFKVDVAERNDAALEETIRFNHAKKGIELHFNDKPTKAVLEVLRSSVFKYHRKNKMWYAKQSESALQEASRIVSMSNETMQTPKLESSPPEHVPLQLLISG